MKMNTNNPSKSVVLEASVRPSQVCQFGTLACFDRSFKNQGSKFRIYLGKSAYYYLVFSDKPYFDQAKLNNCWFSICDPTPLWGAD